MKARLLRTNDEIILAYNTGAVLTPNEFDIKEFFLHADQLTKKNAAEQPVGKVIAITQNTGDTLAYVDDEFNLVITDLPFYRSVMEKPTEYLTAEEYGELHGKKRGIIMRLCRERRLPGTIKKGDIWLIPKDCPYPKDARLGSRIEPAY